MSSCFLFYFFFFNDTATTEIYTLSLHDALPICAPNLAPSDGLESRWHAPGWWGRRWRSEEHTSELQSQSNLVCRLLLEKKKNDCTRALTCSLYQLCLELRRPCQQ